MPKYRARIVRTSDYAILARDRAAAERGLKGTLREMDLEGLVPEPVRTVEVEETPAEDRRAVRWAARGDDLLSVRRYEVLVELGEAEPIPEDADPGRDPRQMEIPFPEGDAR